MTRFVMGKPVDVSGHYFAPRGLSRTAAAAYVGVSPNSFDKLIGERVMPGPKKFLTRVVWDRLELDAAFTAAPHRDRNEGLVSATRIDVSLPDTWADYT